MRGPEITIRCFDRSHTGMHIDMYLVKRDFVDYKERQYYAKIDWVEYEQEGCHLAADEGRILLNRYPESNPVQRLIDDLWNMGIRPTGVKWSNDEVAALKNHIADLKEISTKAINAVCKIK